MSHDTVITNLQKKNQKSKIIPEGFLSLEPFVHQNRKRKKVEEKKLEEYLHRSVKYHLNWLLYKFLNQ